MADQSPDSFHEGHGVKRLNRRPLMLVIGIGTLVAVALGYAVNQRAAAQRAKADPNEGQPGQAHSVQDSSATVADLTKGLPETGVTPATSQVQNTSSIPILPDIQAGMVAAVGSPTIAQELPKIDPVQQQVAKQSNDEWLTRYRQAQQRKIQLYEAALTSPTGKAAETNRTDASGDNSSGSTSRPDFFAAHAAALREAGGGTADPNMQDSKEAFAGKPRPAGYLLATRQAPISAYEVKMGTVIPAVMISGVNSDLPGEMIAQVSQDVYDTATGRFLIIPQGSKLFGVYDSRVSYGQSRVLVSWTRVTFPDASSLDIGGMSGADQAGYGGFKDKVNNHYGRVFGSALLMSLFSAGAQLSQPDSNNVNGNPTMGETIAGSVGQEMSRAGTAMLQKNLDIQPTIEIRPGYRFNVMVSKDIAFPKPYIR